MPQDRRNWAEPFKIKMVEHVRTPPKASAPYTRSAVEFAA